MTDSSGQLPAHAIRFWQRVKALTFFLLMIWLLVSFGFAFYARELAGLSVFGWPLPFYMAAQGTTLVYLALIGVYVLVMKKLDALAAAEAAAEPATMYATQATTEAANEN
jgi:putative solute:sodium symporter small subunit